MRLLVLTQESNSQLLNEIPIRLRWLGWESSTIALRQAKWQIFANEAMSHNFDGKEIHIAARCPNSKVMIIGKKLLPLRELRGSTSQYDLLRMICQVGVDMQHYRYDETFRTMTSMVVSSFIDSMQALKPFDGFMEMPQEAEFKLWDFNLFKYGETATEIYLPYDTVDECLNRALELQFPQQEILKKDLSKIQKPIIQAKIYSLRETA